LAVREIRAETYSYSARCNGRAFLAVFTRRSLSLQNVFTPSKYTALKKSVFFGAIFLLILLGIYLVVVKTTADVARSLADGIAHSFNFTPQVKIEETVVIEQHTPIAELATVARDLMVEYSWSHQWLGSTKTITLRGTFTAKAGFDLTKPFSLTIHESPLRVHAVMPAPTLLSLQMNSYTILKDESGWWNRISDADREHAVRELQRAAREKAEASGMLAEARATVEQRIKEIAERNGALIHFTYPWQER
jgi:hypothetical protein